MTAEVVKDVVSTPAPPSAKELAAAEASLPKLNINVLPDAKTAELLMYSFPNCEPFSTVTIQDMAYKTVKVRVKASEWSTLLDMIPESTPTDRRLSATVEPVAVFTDRVIYGATGVMPVQEAAPPAGLALASAVAEPVEDVAEEPTCKPMPPASSMPFTVIITNIVVFVAVFACGYGGYKGGVMAANGQLAALKGGGYASLSARGVGPGTPGTPGTPGA